MEFQHLSVNVGRILAASFVGWIHFTPKHASWLNMVEVEIGVMASQCLDRRISTKEILVKEVKAWERRRNRDESRIKWLFTLERARAKLGRAYRGLAGQNANRDAA